MKIPCFNNRNTAIISGRQMSVSQIREVDSRSLLMLHLSQVLLCAGFILIFFNNLSVVMSSSNLKVFNWINIAVFSLGFFINAISIPWLYFSSFKNFKKANDFWDQEAFWVMPLFFFGTFFIYGNKSSFTFFLLIVSIIVIFSIHSAFFYLSWKFAANKSAGNLANYNQYNITLQYLTAYYVISIALLFTYDSLQKFLTWSVSNG